MILAQTVVLIIMTVFSLSMIVIGIIYNDIFNLGFGCGFLVAVFIVIFTIYVMYKEEN